MDYLLHIKRHLKMLNAVLYVLHFFPTLFAFLASFVCLKNKWGGEAEVWVCRCCGLFHAARSFLSRHRCPAQQRKDCPANSLRTDGNVQHGSVTVIMRSPNYFEPPAGTRV